MTFLFCLLAAYVLVRASEDVTAAVRQQPPPRQEIRKAKLSARQQGGRNVPQSPAGRYAAGLVDDAWDSAHHRRKLMSDERARRRERRINRRIERRKARDQRRDEKKEEGQADPSEPEQAAPVGFDVEAPAAPELTPEQQKAVTQWKRANAAGETCTIPPDTWDSMPTEVRAELVADAWRHGLRPCGTARDRQHVPLSQLDPDVVHRLQQRGLAEPQHGPSTPVISPPPSSSEQPDDQPDDRSVPGSEPTPETTEDPTPAPAEQEDPSSNVIPFPAAPEQPDTTPQRMELPTMSTPTGEITGLNSAIQYADSLSTYCTHTNDQIGSVLPSGTDASSSCEQAREALAAGGVTGQPLSDVTAVQEQMTAAVDALNQALSQLEAAGAAADSLRERLTSHLSVQESYNANPDAGSKEFVTAE